VCYELYSCPGMFISNQTLGQCVIIKGELARPGHSVQRRAAGKGWGPEQPPPPSEQDSHLEPQLGDRVCAGPSKFHSKREERPAVFARTLLTPWHHILLSDGNKFSD
jgi:hypothetical protein